MIDGRATNLTILFWRTTCNLAKSKGEGGYEQHVHKYN